MTQHEAEEYNHLLINEVIKEAETLGIEGKAGGEFRSEERRVGKECRARW